MTPDSTLPMKQSRAQQLGTEIRASTGSEAISLPLATSQRIIARVTDGIYREPWAAFRELCANAYDADAKRVVIETNMPDFDQIIIRDDGLGMTPETLAYVVENIGGSTKRTGIGAHFHTSDNNDPDLSPGKRPLIGKIGIGLFAVAQLTQHFQIITKAKGDSVRTWATVILKTHNEASLKHASKDEKFEAGRVHIKSETVPKDEFDAHGTTIILHELRPEIRRFLQSVNRWQAEAELGPNGEAMRLPPIYHIGRTEDEKRNISYLASALPWSDEDEPIARFKKLFEAASNADQSSKKSPSLEHLDEYLKTIWKLSLSLPIEYIDDHPFDKRGSDGIKIIDVPEGTKKPEAIPLMSNDSLKDFMKLKSGAADPLGGFDVLFDGVLLRRPIALPNKLNTLNTKSRISYPIMMVGQDQAKFPPKALERAGGELKFEAYLYWNSKIVPKDIQGVCIRVRGASGTLFDPRFLDYQVSEQNRLSQITAEIFVLEGLDGAINIDRESFNFSHPHYLYIQKWLHRALRLLVNRLKFIANEDLVRERAQEQEKFSQSLLERASQVWFTQRGQDSDPPVSETMPTSLPSVIGETRVHWPADVKPAETPLATAIGVVLEAYGVLSDLHERQRNQLIQDLIEVMRVYKAS